MDCGEGGQRGRQVLPASAFICWRRTGRAPARCGGERRWGRTRRACAVGTTEAGAILIKSTCAAGKDSLPFIHRSREPTATDPGTIVSTRLSPSTPSPPRAAPWCRPLPNGADARCICSPWIECPRGSAAPDARRSALIHQRPGIRKDPGLSLLRIRRLPGRRPRLHSGCAPALRRRISTRCTRPGMCAASGPRAARHRVRRDGSRMGHSRSGARNKKPRESSRSPQRKPAATIGRHRNPSPEPLREQARALGVGRRSMAGLRVVTPPTPVRFRSVNPERRRPSTIQGGHHETEARRLHLPRP